MSKQFGFQSVHSASEFDLQQNGAVLVAQIVERSMVRIQSLANFYIEHLFFRQLYLKVENKEKEAENGPFFKKQNGFFRSLRLSIVHQSR